MQRNVLLFTFEYKKCEEVLLNKQTKSKPGVVELKIPPVFGYEDLAMELAVSLAKKMGFPTKKINKLKIAVGEACCNAIEHGNKFQQDTVIVLDFIVEHEVKLQVDVQDQGEGGVELPSEKPVILKKVQDKANRRGWGMFLIKKLVDECRVADTEQGMRLSMAIFMDKEKI